MKEKTIELRKGRPIQVKEFIHEQLDLPRVFLLHGLGGRSDQWTPMIDELSDQFDFIVPDLFGHGASPKPRGNYYKVADFYDDVKALFEYYSKDKNYIVGHSLGGVFATLLASLYPSGIAKLILVTPLPAAPNKTIPFIYRAPVCLLELLKNQLISTFVNMAFAKKSSPKLIEQEVNAINSNPLYVIRSLLLDTTNLKQIMPEQVSVATLVITADEDQLIPKADILAYYKRFPNVIFKEVVEVGHLPMLEKPKEVAVLVREFFDSDNGNLSSPA